MITGVKRFVASARARMIACSSTVDNHKDYDGNYIVPLFMTN